MATDADAAAAALHADALVVDVHTHGPRFLPQPYRSAYRLINRSTMPADQELDVLRPAGVDLAVAKAVGDPIVTRWYHGDPFDSVCAQLKQLISGIRAAGGAVVDDVARIRETHAQRQPAIVLGVEGIDAIGDDLDKVDRLYSFGVRVVVVVHLRDNQIGTTGLPWYAYAGPIPISRRRPVGLTAFGRQVIERMNRLGMVVDVSHADTATTFDIVEASAAPIIASHSGARACQDFARYLTDDEARAVAGSGGVIGLWPYFHHGRGVRDVEDLLGHVRHLCELVGPDHLCIGTDMNGVPGTMAGFRGELDVRTITHALVAGGMSEHDVRGVLGENFLRVLGAVEAVRTA